MSSATVISFLAECKCNTKEKHECCILIQKQTTATSDIRPHLFAIPETAFKCVRLSSPLIIKSVLQCIDCYTDKTHTRIILNKFIRKILLNIIFTFLNKKWNKKFTNTMACVSISTHCEQDVCVISISVKPRYTLAY